MIDFTIFTNNERRICVEIYIKYGTKTCYYIYIDCIFRPHSGAFNWDFGPHSGNLSKIFQKSQIPGCSPVGDDRSSNIID